jgi:ATP-dependent exoDNAse (exonuclease V) beta subunit
MSGPVKITNLSDSAARITALTDHERALLVEAGAGSGKTAIIAGRVALLIAAGVFPGDIVAITFTEAAASELLERIEDLVRRLLDGQAPIELAEALPEGLDAAQRQNLEQGERALDEITCTTIHGFCQQLIKPYPVETGLDPGAAIIDPASAELAYQDLMQAWLSARFGRDRGAQGLGRLPAMEGAGGEEDFFTELLLKAPDETLELIEQTAKFLKSHRKARAPAAIVDRATFVRLAESVSACTSWYIACGINECTTAEFVDDMAPIANLARSAASEPLTGRRIAELLFHRPPQACKQNDTAFKQWRRKGKWQDAAKAAGQSKPAGEQLSAEGEKHYQACGEAYQQFCAALGALAFHRFVKEFDALQDLYRDYKRMAALLDFDDLLHHACKLLKTNEPVRNALARRYPRILVDEFQDTDPVQAEILWHLSGEGEPENPWHRRRLRPGALFLVGDPKQAIYRFRGADVATYLSAKQALVDQDPDAVVEISTNFRSQGQILQFVNDHFAPLLDSAQGQPGFTALAAVRDSGNGPAVAAFEIALDDAPRSNKGEVTVDTARRIEAGIVAELVRRLIGAYPVYDKELKGSRPARAGDIALLAPTGTSLWIYERELETRHIAIATQAGKGFFRRQEVQDLIAVARAIADRRDTLALGALLRGPLVGLTEEQIADEIDTLQTITGKARPLHLWTDITRVRDPLLKHTLSVLQNLARKARHTTPYHLLAEAVEELQVRPLLKARHLRGAERALANVELVLEMARAYACRGIADFARALWDRWQDSDAQTEGRPDAEAQAVSIITMHSAKGLEWPIVIPINSMTALWSEMKFLYRRSDDSVHFKVLDYPSPEYESVRQQESEELRHERVRLWYVALTRSRDLLLLPGQSERKDGDWFSLLGLDTDRLPVFDAGHFKGTIEKLPESAPNTQDLATWQSQAAVIEAAQHNIQWHQPSRHEEAAPAQIEDQVYAGTEAVLEGSAAVKRGMDPHGLAIQGGRRRGIIMHKLIEEVLTGETEQKGRALKERAAQLLAQLGLADEQDPAMGPSSKEMAGAVYRALQLPEIAALRSQLLPEMPVYAKSSIDKTSTLTAGIADAAAIDSNGRIDTVIDWKSDVDPTPKQIEFYRYQVRDYLTATSAGVGLIVFLTSGRIERIVQQL